MSNELYRVVIFVHTDEFTEGVICNEKWLSLVEAQQITQYIHRKPEPPHESLYIRILKYLDRKLS